MTDKVQKIREKVERLKSNLIHGACASQIAMKTRCKEEAYNEVLAILDTMQEEPKFKTGDRIKPIDSCLGSPRTIVDICDSWYVTDQGTLDFEYEDNWELVEEPVSEELETELNKYIKGHFTIDKEQLDRFGIEEKDYMYSMDKSDMLALVEHFTNWQKEKDESTTEDLGEYINELSKQFPEVSFAKLSRIAVRVAKWQKKQCNNEANHALVEQIKTQQLCYEKGMADMKQQMMKNIWMPADGDDLPKIDREVIALVAYDFGHYKVVYAHRPNPNGWNGTNIDTGEEEHFEPEIYGKGGWNQPHVLYWLNARLPYEENKIDK